jgi:hypothetical protein
LRYKVIPQIVAQLNILKDKLQPVSETQSRIGLSDKGGYIKKFTGIKFIGSTILSYKVVPLIVPQFNKILLFHLERGLMKNEL